jgi:hypothetical protein
MALWFKPELTKYNSKGDFLNLELNYADLSSRFTASAIKFHKQDDGSYYVTMIAEDITNVAGSVKCDMPLKCCFCIHSSEYEAYDATTKAKAKFQPCNFEKLLIRYLDSIDCSKVYEGLLNMQPTDFDIEFLNGAIPMEAFKNIKITEITDEAAIAKFEAIKFEGASSGSRSYGKPAQTEAERLTDRLNFVKAQLPTYFPENSTDTVLAVIMASHPVEREALISVISAFIG